MFKEYKTMLWFIKKQYPRYLAGIIAVLIVDGLQLMIPKILGLFADDVQAGMITNDKIRNYALIILAISIVIFIFRFLWRYFINGAARILEYELRNKLVEQLLKLNPSFYNYRKTGDIMAHATNDIKAIRMAMGPAVVMSVDAIILGTATIIIMIFTVGWKLTLVALLPMPFLIFIVTRFGGLIHNRFRAVQEAFSTLSDVTQENIAGVRVIKSFAQEKSEIKRFQKANENKFNKNMYLTKVWSIFEPLVELISAFSFLIVLSYGSILVINQEISLGDFVAFYGYLLLLMWPIMAFSWVYNMLQRGSASLKRINTLLDEIPEIDDTKVQSLSTKPVTINSAINENEHTTIFSLRHKDITINNLNFRYKTGQDLVLKNINYLIAHSKVTAIMGHTGSGKSTLVQLLIRQFNPPDSSILIDGTDILSIPFAALNNRIGYVPQDSFLFTATIRENIAFGNPDASQEAIEHAAWVACLDQDLTSFPDGYDTLVGERGITLSGGQKQRLSIARAIVRAPDLFIMDDSLSAVDTKTEELILSRLSEFMKERTTIIIAHRVSSIRHADNILILNNGQLIEYGSHEQLMNIRNLYYKMFIQQQLEQKLSTFDYGGAK